MTIYRSMQASILPPQTRLCSVDIGLPSHVDMDAPATSVMTDLRRMRAVTIHPDATVELANQRMIHAHVRLLFVTDPNDYVVGLVTARDLLGEKPIRIAVGEAISRDAVPLHRIMVPRELIQVWDYTEVQHSSVGDVVRTLHDCGRQHALVLERGERDSIRGIFSTTQIGRQLGIAIEGSERLQSFAEVGRELAMV